MSAPRRNKSTAKAPLPDAERIRRHFKSLIAQIDGGHLNNALKTCDKILRMEPNDTDALNTKVILMLQTNKYEAALSLAESIMSDQKDTDFSNHFAKAYALYRLNRESKAAEMVHSIQSKSDHEERGVLHIEAQIEYRRGNYQKSQELYSHIFDTSPPESDEQADSLINLNASQAHLDFLQSGYLRSLHDLPQTTLNSIEEIPPPSIVPPHPILTTTQQVVPPRENKQLKKPRLPKNYKPGITPDPERWIKKSERTNVHHGGKRRKGGGNATQGSVVETSNKSSGGKGKKKK